MPEFKPLNRFTFGIILLATIEVVSAQIYPARFYSTLDGMPSNSIFDITQDHNGLMWFVTSKGVVSYDGQKWIQPPDSIPLPHSEYSHIKSLPDNSIWVAGQNNIELIVSYFKNDKWTFIDLPKACKEIEYGFTFDVIHDNGNYKMWITSPTAIYFYQSESDSWNTYPISFNINTILSHEGILYLCTTQGLYQLKDDQPTPVKFDQAFLNNDVLNIVFKNDNLHILGFNWIAIAKEGVIESYWERLGMTSKSRFKKHRLLIDDRERIFYNCDSPILMFNPESGKSEIIEIKDKIQNAKSIAIYKDVENNIWVGDHRGLFRFNLLRFLNFNRRVGLLEDEVTSILQLQNGEIVLANSCSLNFLSGNKVKAKYPIPTEPDKICRVLDMMEDESGNLYLALGPSGLYLFKSGKFKKIVYPPQPDIDFTSIKLWRNKIYATSIYNGIFEVRNEKLEFAADLRGIRNLTTLEDRAIIGATRNGILKITSKDTVRITGETRDSRNVYSVLEWNGELLAATLDGLYKVKDDSISDEKYLDIDGPTYSIISDRSNNLWIGGGDGVLKWDGKILKKFDKSHGLVGSEINRNALIQDSEGSVWIGTESGASVYKEAEDLTLNLTPRVSITSIVDSQGNRFDPEVYHEFPFNNNTIEIHFRGVSFLNEDRISYRYMLEGLDSEWFEINNNTSTSGRYTNLKSGKYTLIVQSKIDQGRWSDPVEASFGIDLPFYYKWWFVILCMVFISIALYAIYRIRFYYLIQRQEELKELVKARTREIMQLNQSLEANVKDRTKELEEKNQRLSDYAYINAHLLRGPLTRIQSLTLLMELKENEELSESFLEILKTATDELDDVIFSINSTLEKKSDIKSN